uniref:Putative BLUF domain protein n=1 Tax=Magnetococcus massalia (strain MO-1) TaxID=451514 RepID=A0A1S7LHI6_MAGMO|nr:Putative BLUF domain protein [Candidatus Magnetococcus massalia]
MSENLCRLAYVSQVKSLDHKTLHEILQVSRRHNQELQITGALFYHNALFFQLLEGPQGRVEKLFDTISADTRHENCQRLLLEPIEDRSFGNWYMGHASIERMSPAEQRDYGEKSHAEVIAMESAELNGFIACLLRNLD